VILKGDLVREADVRRAQQEGKLAVSFNFQDTNPVAGNLHMVEVYRRLGVHHMLMASTRRTPWAMGVTNARTPVCRASDSSWYRR
jgi:microsomal dipeptidase-like Zn-dependent dipeptidase